MTASLQIYSHLTTNELWILVGICRSCRQLFASMAQCFVPQKFTNSHDTIQEWCRL